VYVFGFQRSGDAIADRVGSIHAQLCGELFQAFELRRGDSHVDADDGHWVDANGYTVGL